MESVYLETTFISYPVLRGFSSLFLDRALDPKLATEGLPFRSERGSYTEPRMPQRSALGLGGPSSSPSHPAALIPCLPNPAGITPTHADITSRRDRHSRSGSASGSARSVRAFRSGHIDSDATIMTRECSGSFTPGSTGRTNPFSTIPAMAIGCVRRN